jgi:hypothetical protein
MKPEGVLMAEFKPKKLQFAPTVTSPRVEINNGEYHRAFDEKDQPFEASGFSRVEINDQGEETEVVVMTPREEEGLLLRSGLFVDVDAEKEAPVSDATTAGGEVVESSTAPSLQKTPPPPPARNDRPSNSPAKGKIGGAPASPDA